MWKLVVQYPVVTAAQEGLDKKEQIRTGRLVQRSGAVRQG
jgi:hypothetical protein